MRYLITGTAGFIGFHLAQRLMQAGVSLADDADDGAATAEKFDPNYLGKIVD